MYSFKVKLNLFMTVSGGLSFRLNFNFIHPASLSAYSRFLPDPFCLFVCIFKVWPISDSSVIWSLSLTDLLKRLRKKMSHAARCCLKVNMKETEVSDYGFIRNWRVSGSQQTCEQDIAFCKATAAAAAIWSGVVM